MYRPATSLYRPATSLIHAGDMSVSGSFQEIQRQIDWLKSQPHAHKIFIAGNHDLALTSRIQRKLNWDGLTYLQRQFFYHPARKWPETEHLWQPIHEKEWKLGLRISSDILGSWLLDLDNTTRNRYTYHSHATQIPS